jgi:anaerobic selenocysteine-containing dehydrogenase
MVAYKPLKRLFGTRKEYDRFVRTVCEECTVGCGLLVYVQDDRIVDVSGDESHPISRGRLCAKGIAFVQALHHPERITLPGSRNRLQGSFEAFDNWEKGLDLLAERLKRVKDQHKPESLVIACDPMAGLDFLMGARRFAKLWGTPHVYYPLDDPVAPSEQLPISTPVKPCTDWINSKCLFLVEADIAVTHPVAFQWVLDAQKNGAKIIACDTRFTATLSKADVAVLISPGSGNLLGAYLMKKLIDENLIQQEFCETHFSDMARWKNGYLNMSLEDAQEATGVFQEKILELSRMLGNLLPSTVITGKRLAFQKNYHIWLTLATAMGWIDKTGGGWYPLESGNAPLNPVKDIYEKNPEISSSTGMIYPYQTRKQAHVAPAKEEFKAMIGSGNCLNDFLSPFKSCAKDMDLVVYFGAFPNFTRQSAHMVFPVTLWPERYGVCFNNDRILQWGERIVAPSDACRTGLGFWMRLSQRLGWDEYFPWKKANGLADHAAFYDWLLSKQPETEGITVDLIKENPVKIFWPFKKGLLKDNAPFFPNESGKMVPAPAPEKPAPLMQEEIQNYPLYYHSTRITSVFSDSSHWQPWTRELADEKAVQIHPETAKALGIENGDGIVISVNGDLIEGCAWLSRTVTRNMIWSTKRLGYNRVLVYKKGQDPQEALKILRKILQ